jgi:hypothetical protein
MHLFGEVKVEKDGCAPAGEEIEICDRANPARVLARYHAT